MKPPRQLELFLNDEIVDLNQDAIDTNKTGNVIYLKERFAKEIILDVNKELSFNVLISRVLKSAKNY